MLVRILSFLLESLFFVLIASCLLRAWMNWLRINMRVQPGLFVMAVTDWLVKPLRRAMPTALAQSRVDWASIGAALIFALAYGLIWSLLIGLLLGASVTDAGDMAAFAVTGILGVLGFALKTLIRVALQSLFFMVLAFAVLSWVQPGSPLYHQLGRLIDPLIAPLRRVVPTIGGVDLSALVLMLILQIALMVLG